MRVRPDTGQEGLRIKASIHALNILKTKDLSWLKEHSAELSGLNNYWILNMTWAELIKDALEINIDSVKIGGRRRVRKLTRKVHRRKNSRRN
jgi:hypothetical protein